MGALRLVSLPRPADIRYCIVRGLQVGGAIFSTDCLSVEEVVESTPEYTFGKCSGSSTSAAQAVFASNVALLSDPD